AGTFSNNVLTIGGNSYTLAAPSTYSPGQRITISGSLISNSAPDRTVTIQPSGTNVQVTGTYPDFTVASTPSLTHNNGSLGISDGNVVNITPTLSLNGGVLTVGPSTNTVLLPSAATTSITATG